MVLLSNKHRKPTQENDLKKVNFINFKKDNENDIKSIGFELLDFERVKENNYNLCGAVYRGINDYSGEFESVKLNEICDVVRGGSPRPINEYLTDDENGLNWLRIGDIAKNGKYITKTKEKIKQEGLYKTRLIKKDNLIISNSMSFGRPYITKIDVCIHDGLVALINFKIDVSKEFLYYIIKSDFVQNQFAKQAKGSAVDNLNIDIFKNISIPLPDLSTQQEIVNQIEQEEKIIENNKMLTEIMSNKMRKKIDNLLNGL